MKSSITVLLLQSLVVVATWETLFSLFGSPEGSNTNIYHRAGRRRGRRSATLLFAGASSVGDNDVISSDGDADDGSADDDATLLLDPNHDETNDDTDFGGGGDDDGTTTIPKENGLFVLTQDNFGEALRQYGAILVVFYAPWCEHSHPLVTKMERTSQLLTRWEDRQRRYLEELLEEEEATTPTSNAGAADGKSKRHDDQDDDDDGEKKTTTSTSLLPIQIDLNRRKRPPRLAKVDATTTTKEFVDIFHLKGYPTMKLVIPDWDDDDDDSSSGGQRHGNSNQGGDDDDDDDDDETTTPYFSVVDYPTDIDDDDDNRLHHQRGGGSDKMPSDLLSFLIHRWSRYPSPVFSVTKKEENGSDGGGRGGTTAARGLQRLLGWIDNERLNPAMIGNPYVSELDTNGDDDTDDVDNVFRRGVGGAVVFIQCQRNSGNGGDVFDGDDNADDKERRRRSNINRQRADAECDAEGRDVKDSSSSNNKNSGGGGASSCHQRDHSGDDESSMRQQQRVRDSIIDFERMAEEMIGQKHVMFVSLHSECESIGLRYNGEIRAVVTPTSSARMTDDDGGGDGGGELDSETNPPYLEKRIFDPLSPTDGVVESQRDFIKRESLPLIVWFNGESIPTAFGRNRTVHVCLFLDESALSSERTTVALTSLQRAALRHRHAESHVFMVIPSWEYRVTDYFGINRYPSVLITDTRDGGMRKFFLSHTDLTNADAIDRFVVRFEEGSLRPLLKSQPISDEDTSGIVKVVKGWSFDSMVMKSKRHTLVNFFAPFCAHSKHLGPKWNDLANLVHHLDWNIDVMKMDATENEIDHPNVTIDGFPTIYYFPLGNKTNPLRYEGRRSHGHDFVTWLYHNGLRSEMLDDEEEGESSGSQRGRPVQ